MAAAQQIETVQTAVDHRTIISKAIGIVIVIVMARYGLDEEQAFSVLRRLSSHSDRRLFDVAADGTTCSSHGC